MLLPWFTYALLLLALAFDLRERRIPNWLTAGAALLGLATQLILLGRAGLGSGLAGFLLGLVVLLPLFIIGKFGGGDLKLLAAIGALRGFTFLWKAALLAALSGGVFAVGTLLLHGELLLATYGLAGNSYRSQRSYPYSPAIAVGVLLADLGRLL